VTNDEYDRVKGNGLWKIMEERKICDSVQWHARRTAGKYRIHNLRTTSSDTVRHSQDASCVTFTKTDRMCHADSGHAICLSTIQSQVETYAQRHTNQNMSMNIVN
jgi:hypothetical protein